ncbi:MAG TPA: agmatinase [Capsulimonadaceae bacterium]|jgi:agmatinase
MPDHSYEFLPPANFLGLPAEFTDRERSRVHVLPIPFEATTTYSGGAKNGPAAILRASTQVELYDREFRSEPALDYGVHTFPSISLNLSSPPAAVNGIAKAVADIAHPDKLLCVLGGEHTTSVGVAEGLLSVHGSFVTVQIDAHADLRDLYEGTRFSHACAMRRVLELGGKLIQFGIRSLDVTEAEYLADNGSRVTTYYADEMRSDRSYLSAVADAVRGQNVFLTIDVDGFDPSIVPATGTPEPGGLLWYDGLDIIRAVASTANIIAFDIVELAPIAGQHAPDFTVAKLAYKTMNISLASPAWRGRV